MNTNLEILSGVRALLTATYDRDSAPDEELKRTWKEELQLCVSRLTMHRKWAEHSLARVQGISDLVCNVKIYLEHPESTN
jgi:hypothetical protein